MNNIYNLKLAEIKEIFNGINLQEQFHNWIDNLGIASPRNHQEEKLNINNNLNELSAKNDDFSSDSAESEEIKNAIKMKYAILLIRNYVNS